MDTCNGNERFDFGCALLLLRSGFKLYRLSWSEGTYIVYIQSKDLVSHNTYDAKLKVNDELAQIVGNDSSVTITEYLIKIHPGDEENHLYWDTYLPNNSDLFGTDWAILSQN